jgi:hypothetical protein
LTLDFNMHTSQSLRLWRFPLETKGFLQFSIPCILTLVNTFQLYQLNAQYMEIKRLTRCNIWFFIVKLIVRSTFFRHHYAHYPELRFAGCCSIQQTRHITYSSTPDQQPVNQSTKYHRRQPPV